MSQEEMRRAGVLERVKTGEIPLGQAARDLRLSYRHVKRLYARYSAGGAKGLVHGNAEKPSHHAKPAKLRQKVLRLVRQQYTGKPGESFGPTLAAEHLAQDHKLKIDPETLRRWMLAEGLWTPRRKHRAYRRRRPRREQFGALVQMDGSFHLWLEQRAGKGCLINMVDDATSTGLGLFDQEETTWTVADTLRLWVQTYGIPLALYVDWKNVYHHEPTRRQQQDGIVPLSQFGRMCAKLGVELIGAHSPQAKGRVERSHGTHQDRLIKKLRLRQVKTYPDANRYLAERYWKEHNTRYAVAPANTVDLHRAVPTGLDLEQVFCLESERTLSQDWVVETHRRLL